MYLTPFDFFLTMSPRFLYWAPDSPMSPRYRATGVEMRHASTHTHTHGDQGGKHSRGARIKTPGNTAEALDREQRQYCVIEIAASSTQYNKLRHTALPRANRSPVRCFIG